MTSLGFAGAVYAFCLVLIPFVLAVFLTVSLIPATIQFVIGNLVQPKMMGESLDPHLVVVLLSLIFFGTIWGIIAMFVAVPITAVIKIFL